MTSQRTDGLATLSRLKHHEIESVALEMAEVNRALTRIESERQALLQQVNERGDPDAIESTRVLSAFIRNVSEAIHRKEDEARRMRDSSADSYNKLNALYAEAKQIDLVRQRRHNARRKKRDDAETAAQSDGFLAIWIQQQRDI